MRIRHHSRLIPTVLAFTTLAVALTLAPQAHAAWESIGACPGFPNEKLNARDNRPLRIMPGFKGDVVVFGHLLDMAQDVRLTGITGGSAANPRGVSGFVNSGSGVVGRRGCALGSTVVEISASSTAPRGQRGTLIIGGERIPVEIVVDSFTATWDARNNSASLTPGTQEQIEADVRASAQNAQQTCLANTQTRFQICVADRPALEAQRAQACAAQQAAQAANQAAGVTSIQVGTGRTSCSTLLSCDNIRQRDSASCNGIEPRLSTPRAPRCLRDLGGSSLFLADGALEISLPPADRASDAQLQTCLARGFDVSISRTYANQDFGGGQCAKNAVHEFSVGRQSGGFTTRVNAVSSDCSSHAVLFLPTNVRQATLFTGRGAVTVNHRAFNNGTTDSIPDMGESTITLNYVIVPPRAKLNAPVLRTKTIPRLP